MNIFWVIGWDHKKTSFLSLYFNIRIPFEFIDPAICDLANLVLITFGSPFRLFLIVPQKLVLLCTRNLARRMLLYQLSVTRNMLRIFDEGHMCPLAHMRNAIFLIREWVICVPQFYFIGINYLLLIMIHYNKNKQI